MKACFFVKLPNKSYLEHVEFYKQDINILQDLGFKVVCATRWSEIPWAVDFLFIWWWTWAFLPLTKAYIKKCPTIVTGVFDHMWQKNEWDFSLRPWWQQRLIRFGLKHAAVNVFISKQEFERIPKILEVNNPHYSPLSVDTSIYHPGDGSHEDIVFTTSWLEGMNPVRKSIPEIIRAARTVVEAYPKVRFVIAGERGSYYPKLIKMTEELGLADRIIFPGKISREKKIKYMQHCKVYLQPSKHEGFGLAILEAMSCGAPVVTSPTGAIPEVVGETAMFAEATSPDSIAQAVIRLLENESLRIRLGEQARKRAEEEFPYRRRKKDLEGIIYSLF